MVKVRFNINTAVLGRKFTAGEVTEVEDAAVDQLQTEIRTGLCTIVTDEDVTEPAPAPTEPPAIATTEVTDTGSEPPADDPATPSPTEPAAVDPKAGTTKPGTAGK